MLSAATSAHVWSIVNCLVVKYTGGILVTDENDRDSRVASCS